MIIYCEGCLPLTRTWPFWCLLELQEEKQRIFLDYRLPPWNPAPYPVLAWLLEREKEWKRARGFARRAGLCDPIISGIWYHSGDKMHEFEFVLDTAKPLCLLGFLPARSAGTIYFASLPCKQLKAPSQGSAQPFCARRHLCVLKRKPFSGMPCVLQPAPLGPPHLLGWYTGSQAEAATFQPASPALSNCYLSNRSARHLGRFQMRASSHEILNLPTFDLSCLRSSQDVVSQAPSIPEVTSWESSLEGALCVGAGRGVGSPKVSGGITGCPQTQQGRCRKTR